MTKVKEVDFKHNNKSDFAKYLVELSDENPEIIVDSFCIVAIGYGGQEIHQSSISERNETYQIEAYIGKLQTEIARATALILEKELE